MKAWINENYVLIWDGKKLHRVIVIDEEVDDAIQTAHYFRLSEWEKVTDPDSAWLYTANVDYLYG